MWTSNPALMGVLIWACVYGLAIAGFAWWILKKTPRAEYPDVEFSDGNAVACIKGELSRGVGMIIERAPEVPWPPIQNKTNQSVTLVDQTFRLIKKLEPGEVWYPHERRESDLPEASIKLKNCEGEQDE